MSDENLPVQNVPVRRITIKDFKMWLEGVEEMQASDWVPDARQWQRIREKINSIEDIAPAPVYTLPERPQGLTYRGPDVPVAPGVPVIPAGPSLLPTQNFAVGAPRSFDNLTGPFATNSQQAVKTQNIDTMGKPYESSFA